MGTSLFGTLDIGHKIYPGLQRVQCWPFPELKYYGSNREDFVFILPEDFVFVLPPGVEHFVLDSDKLWYR